MVSHLAWSRYFFRLEKYRRNFKNLLFFTAFEQTLLKTQFPHQWVAGVLSQAAKRPEHKAEHLVPIFLVFKRLKD
jgi:hypothetical protein